MNNDTFSTEQLYITSIYHWLALVGLREPENIPLSKEKLAEKSVVGITHFFRITFGILYGPYASLIWKLVLWPSIQFTSVSATNTIFTCSFELNLCWDLSLLTLHIDLLKSQIFCN